MHPHEPPVHNVSDPLGAPDARLDRALYQVRDSPGATRGRYGFQVSLTGVPAFAAELVRQRAAYSAARPARVRLLAQAMWDLFVAGARSGAFLPRSAR